MVRNFLYLAVLLCGVSLAAAGPASDCTSNPGWSVTSVDHYYDAVEDVTVFTYQVSAAAGAGDLSHFSLAAPSCQSATVEETDDWQGLGSDAGFTFRRVFGVEQDSTETATLTLDGQVAFADVAVSLNGAECSSTGVVRGPDCSATPAYGSPCGAGWEGPIEDIECGSDELAALLADPAVNRTVEGEASGCDANTQITRIAWDNFAICPQVIHVVDSTPPVLTLPEGVNDTVYISCDDEVPEPVEVLAEDNCGEASVSHCTDTIDGRCPDNKFITYTWKGVDECGNEDCITQTIVVEDKEAPVLSAYPEDPEPFECPKDIRDFDIVDPITATDNCDTGVTVDATEEVLQGDCEGEYAIVRSWTATDACDNTVKHEQHIVVRDTQAPVWGGEFDKEYPSTVYCALPAGPVITANDACAGDLEPVFNENVTPGSCPQEKFVRWTFDVCDDCGNAATQIVIDIHVNDLVKPTFDLEAEDDITVQCNEVPEQRYESASDDCDDAVVNATCTEVKTASDNCDDEYTLTRTCRVEDACGNFDERVRVITVIDEMIECPANPEDETHECSAVPTHERLTAPEQNCSQSLTQVLGNEEYTEACTYDIERFWTFTDDCGNACNTTQTLHIVDTTKPVFDNCPEDISNFCDLPEVVLPTATDNCQEVTVTSEDVVTAAPCTGRQTVTRTYYASDNCGNVEECSHTIEVYDNDAPTWVTFPEDLNLSCEDEFDVMAPTASDACSTAVVVKVSDESVYSCPNAYVRTIVYQAVDSCGNTSPERSHVITVVDNTDPILNEPLPADQTDECSELSCPADVDANDNCEGLELTYEQERIETPDEGCSSIYQLQRRWTATDACANTDTHTQIVTVQDTNAPVYQLEDPADQYISCELEIVPPTEPETEWSDLCGDVTFVSRTNTTRATGRECEQNQTTTFVWTVRDECGNEATVDQKWFVFDLTPPVLEDLDDITFECDAEIVLDTPEYSDACSNALLSSTEEPTDLDCPSTGYLSQNVITYTATDPCGNAVSTSRTVRVTDTIAPEMECPPAIITGTCCNVPEPVVLTATDNCAADEEITAVVTRQDGPCDNTYNLTYTWTATDACDNAKVCVQTVVVRDDTPPTLEGVPTADDSASCEDIPKPPKVCAKDNCGDVTIDFNETRTGGDVCDSRFTLIRTWTAIDGCGHNVTESYNLVVTDDVDPVWNTPLPADRTEECARGAAEPTVTAPTCGDACVDVTVTPGSSSDSSVGNCPEDVDYHFDWTCADDCGNSISHSVTVEVRDTTDPYFTAVLPPASVSYDCEPEEPAVLTAGDACTDASVELVESEPEANTSCPIQKTWTRTWTASDECGHSIEHVQTVFINRPALPTFDFSPEDQTIGCQADVPAAADLNATDGCGNDVEVIFSETIENEACDVLTPGVYTEYDLVRTWTATDQCGNTIVESQTIFVRDMRAPTVKAPAPRVQHNQCVQAADPTSPPGSDDCAVEVTKDVSDGNTPRDCPYLWNITYTWTATDNCGKTAVNHTTEVYTYDLKPQVEDRDSIPTLRMANCDNVETNPDEIQWLDGCGARVEGGEVETTIEEGSCPNNYTQVWTYTVTDDCEQSNTFVIRTRVRDQTPPVIHFEWPVEDALVECPFVPPAPEATATDSCGGDVTLEFVEFKVGFDDSDPDYDCCNYDIYRIWKATDACGLTATVTQHIRVEDTIPPRWTGPEIMDRVVECPEDVERPAIEWFEAPFAHGFCAGSTESTNCTDTDLESFQLSIGGVEYVIGDARFVRWVNGFAFLTGTASAAGQDDLAVNLQLNLGSVSTSQGLAQSINNDTLKAECYTGSDGVVLAQWVFYEEVQGNLTNSVSGDLHEVTGATFVQLGLGATGRNELYGLRTRLTTGLGDAELVLQLNECNTDDWEFPELECGPSLETRNETEVVEGRCPGEWVKTYTWFATDAAGNTNSTSMIVTSHDLTPPTFDTTPAASVTGVCEPPVQEDPTASDTCSTAAVSLAESDKEYLSRDCEFHYTFVRTWTAVDECGNDAQTEQTVTVEDNVNPTLELTGVPTNRTIQCFALLEPIASVACADNCDDVVPTCEGADNTPKDGSNCDVQIDYTFTAVDSCGNTATDGYSVTVKDTRAPVCVGDVCGDSSVRVPCEDGVPAKLTATFEDNCDGTISVEPVRTVTGTCPTVYTDVYSINDTCDNAATSFTKVYRVYDETKPVISVPANRTVADCGAWNTPTAEEEIASGAVSVTDNCDGSVVVTHVEDSLVYDGDCLILVVRSWTATDNCGNTGTAVSYIIVDDNSAPVFSPASIPDVTIECDEDVPCPETVSISDNCPGVDLTFAETVEQGDCPAERVFTRVWTATDACSNTDTLVHTIKVVDTTDPVWTSALPSGGSYTCESVPSNSAADMSASDNCGDAVVTYDEERTDGSCPDAYTLRRVWNATDACGNQISHFIVLDIHDNTAPFAADLTDIAHECDLTDPEFGTPSFTDNCGEVAVTSEDNTVEGCGATYTKTRTWTGTDDCSNSYSVDQVITVTDTVAPSLAQPERQVSGECTNTTEPFPASSDACDTDLTKSSTDVLTPDSDECSHPYTIERSWTVTDDCDNSATVYQTVRIVDTDVPSLDFGDELPEDATVSCTQTVGYPAVTASDPCQGDLTADIEVLEPVFNGQPGDCSYTETRTWRVCDCSNNCDEHSQTITYVDQIAPVFGAIPDAGPFGCADEVEIPNAPASDPDCTGEEFSIVADSEIVDRLCEFNYTIRAHYTAADSCGNSVTATKDFIHRDNEAPVVNGVFDDVTIECGAEVPVVPFFCTDNCDTGDSGLTDGMSSEEIEDDDECENTRTIKQTYTCTDSCGLSSERSRFVYVVDTTAPQWTSVPQPDREYQCDEELPVNEPTASDNCHATVVNRLDDTTEEGACPGNYTVTHHWEAVDQCNGLTNTTSQTYNVTDTSKPTLEGCLQDFTAECDDVPCPATVTASDTCPGVTLDYTSERTDGDCPSNYTLTRTWTATDACGNTESCSHTVTVSDSVAPAFTGTLPGPESYECDEMVPAMEELPFEDSCSEVVQTMDETTEESGCEAYTITRTWTLTDACDHVTEHVQTIEVRDTKPPVRGNNTCVCNEPVYDAAYATFADALALVSFGVDDCGDSSTTVTVESCTSSQDAELGVDVVDGFSADCHLVGDALKVRLRASLVQANGRLFDVVFKAVDGCGNAAYTHHYVWVPLDQDSDFATGFPDVAEDEDTDTEACSTSCITVTPPEFCRECECRYGVKTCEPDGEQVTESSATLASVSWDSVTATTHVVYEVSANGPGGLLSSVVIGVDLGASGVEVLDVTDGAALGGASLPFATGPRPNSIFSGIVVTKDFFVDGSTASFSVILSGRYGERVSVPYELGASGSDAGRCHRGMTESVGPRIASAEKICGSVGIYGTILGGAMYSDMQVALGGVTVRLSTAADGDVSSTVTATDGTFCFDYLASGATYSVYLPSSGLFELAQEFSVDRSAEYFVPAIAIDNVFPFGDAVSATAPASAIDFKLFLNNVHVTDGMPTFYSDGSTDYFKGTSRSAGFWSTQLQAVIDADAAHHCPLRPFLPLSQTRAFAAAVDAALASRCSFAAGASAEERLQTALAGNDVKAKIATVALNHMSGHGVLEPYRILQGTILEYALVDVCDHMAADPSVEGMLDELLGAM